AAANQTHAALEARRTAWTERPSSRSPDGSSTTGASRNPTTATANRSLPKRETGRAQPTAGPAACRPTGLGFGEEPPSSSRPTRATRPSPTTAAATRPGRSGAIIAGPGTRADHRDGDESQHDDRGEHAPQPQRGAARIGGVLALGRLRGRGGLG